MFDSSRTGLLALASVLAVLLLAAALALTSRGRQYDPDFDARVAAPAYRGLGPTVLYDEGHLNAHAAGNAYKPLADLLRNDGYDLRVSRRPLSAAALAGVSVLAIVGARGQNDAGDGPAFTEAEADAVERWVRAGGSLLLVTDHWPYGPAAEPLARRFGVQMGGGLVGDPKHHHPTLGESHLVFSEENGLLGDHPIVHGRSPAERVRRVVTFTGQSILGPPGAVAFLALSDAALERPPTAPRVEKRGGNVRVTMEYGAPAPARGRAQGLALEADRGRVVVLGEAGLLRAQRNRDGTRVGMNVRGYDDRQLALNIMHWLSRIL